MMYVLGFFVSGAVVVFAGTARHAGAIAAVTKLGRSWIGPGLAAWQIARPPLHFATVASCLALA